MDETENTPITKVETKELEIAEQIPNLLGNWVTMKNITARAAHGFSLIEKRIVMAGLSQIDSRRSTGDYSTLASRTVKITAADYADISKTSVTDAYRDLVTADKKLFERYLQLKVMTPTGEKTYRRRWVEEIQYQSGEGWISFAFTQAILPHLVGIKEQFTKYRLEQASGLRSIYSWRMLEMLISHEGQKKSAEADYPQGKGTKKVTLEEMRYLLEIPDSYKWINIRQRVIEPAVKELNNKDKWEINWTPIKKARTIVAVDFVWQKSTQQDLFI